MHREKLYVVLADDDNDDRLFFKSAFEHVRVKHELLVFEDGYELMNYLESAAEPPHIVFLDLNMPGKPGLECLNEIRANPLFRDLTVAIYSTSSSPEDIEDTFVAGANIYIKKPDDFMALKKIMADVLSVSWLYVTDGLNRENFIISY